MQIAELLIGATLSVTLFSSEITKPACLIPGQCILEVGSQSQPLNGTWAFKLDRVTRNGSCLPQISFILEPMIKGAMVERTITWSRQFHPDDMQLDVGSRKIVWKETEPGAFVSEQQATRSTIVKAKYSVRPLDQLNISLTVEYFLQDSPPEYGMKDCIVTVDYTASYAKRYLSSDEH